MMYRRIVAPVAIVLATVSAGHALAQTAPPVIDTLPSNDDIVVTAQKRPESVQHVAAAITAISGSDLAQRGITSFSGLAQQIPGLSFGGQTGATFVTIRGVGTQVETGVSEPSVALYVDGIYLSRSTMAALALKDLARVEVLRGPQGTLYGRNATGGAVNFISNAPTNRFSAGLDLKVGNYGRRSVDAFVSGPLSDAVLVRLSAGRDRDDGYVENIFNGQRLANLDQWYAKGAVRLLPASNLTIDLTAQYLNDGGGVNYQELFNLTPAGILPTGTVQTSAPYQLASDKRSLNRITTFIAGGTINWRVSDAVNFRSITGYVKHSTLGNYDADSTSYAYLAIDGFRRPTRTFSQEFNLSGETGRLKWLAGAFFFDEKFFATLPVYFPSGLGAARPPGSNAVSMQDEHTRSFALFTDLTFSLTDTLRIVGGLRYNNEKKDFLQTVGLQTPSGFTGSSNVPSSTQQDKVLPKIAVQFDVTHDVLAYAQFQKGLKSGGLNLSVLGGFYQPESITAYEAGLKTSFAHGRVTANLSGFHYEYRNYQLMQFLTAGQSFVQNADARVTGAEFELGARPVSNLRLSASGTYLDAHYTRFLSADPVNLAGGTLDLSGKRLNRSPKLALRASVDYRLPIAGSFLTAVSLHADAIHSSSIFFRPFNSAADLQPAYEFVNGGLIVDAGAKYRIRLYVDNLTDAVVKSEVLYSGSQRVFAGNYAAPRTYGVELSLRLP